MAVSCSQNKDPACISYLLDSKHEHDCYFLVGNPKLCEPERIGAVKKLLFAHSEVLRREWSSGDIPVEDLYPDTFKDLLRYVYGYDRTSDMSFDDADNLLYAAEKYQIESLKSKLATRLISLLTADNVCSLLNNPACYSVPQLGNEISKILKNEIKSIVESSALLSLNPEAFLKILLQYAMSVTEIEIWRAALKWAKEQAGSEDGNRMRRVLREHLKHIRFCTLEMSQFIREVVPTSVLTDMEVKLVCLSIELTEKQKGLTEICNEIKPRDKSRGEKKIQTKKYTSFGHLMYYDWCTQSNRIEFKIITKKTGIHLFSFKFTLKSHSLTNLLTNPFMSIGICDDIGRKNYRNTTAHAQFNNMYTTSNTLWSVYLLPESHPGIMDGNHIQFLPATSPDNKDVKHIHLLPESSYHIVIDFGVTMQMNTISKYIKVAEDAFKISFPQHCSNMLGFEYRLV